MLFIICSAHCLGSSPARREVCCPSELGLPDTVLNGWTNMLKFSAKHRLLKCQPLSCTSSETHKARHIPNPDNTGPGREQILSQPEQRNNYIPRNSAVLHFCFLVIIPWRAPLQPHTDRLIQHHCSWALGCMWASSSSVSRLQSPYAGMAKWPPWHAQFLRRKELLHTDHSAMTVHGQLRNQRGALCRAQPPPGSLSHGGKALNHVAAQCGSLQQHGLRGQRVSSKTLPWQGQPVVQL